MRIFALNFFSMYILFGGFLGFMALKWTEDEQPRRYISEPSSEHLKFFLFMTFLWFPFFVWLGALAFASTKRSSIKQRR